LFTLDSYVKSRFVILVNLMRL